MEKHKCKLCFKNFANGRALGGHMRSRNPTRRRSKRTRKLEANQQYSQEADMIKNLKSNNKNKIIESCSWGHHEPEPVSSISDNTTEEDGAYCLMMLSRDKWKRKAKNHHHQQQEQRPSQQQRNQNQEDDHHVEDEEADKSMEETDKSEEFKSFNNHNNTNNHKNGSKGKYKCETCKKVFKSYQALGGHRASHKKIRFYTPVQETQLDQENAGGLVPMPDKKVHECPVCFRAFSSGQALGGHKRTHVTGSVVSSSSAAAAAAGSTYIATSVSASASMKLGENLIDLNLPAPNDDDEDISQIESSAVSDAEFVNHVKTMN